MAAARIQTAMEGNADEGASVSGSQRIKLNVLSPSIEVPDKTTLNDCTVSTTVAELKAKICNAVPSNPAPERQRLIYRGRPLLQDNATLKDIFTKEVIDDSQELSLHLVLPPSTASHNTHPPSAPGSNIPHGTFHSNAPQLGRRTPVSHQHGPGGGLGGMPQVSFVPHPPGQPGAFPVPHGVFPPQVQAALHNHLQMLGQQLGNQMAMQGNPASMVQGPPNPNLGQNSQHEAVAFQQYIRQQQQARALAGQHGAGDNTGGQTAPSNAGTTSSLSMAPTFPANLSNSTAAPPTTNTVIQENRGPNGESWRIVIQSTSTVTGLNSAMQRVPTPVNTGSQQQPQAGIRSVPSPSAGPTPSPTPGQGPPRAPNQMQLRILEQEMTAIQTALTRGTAPAPSVFERARTMLRNIEDISETPGLEAMLRNQVEVLSAQADQVRANLNNRLLQVVSDQPSPQPAIQAMPAQQITPQATASSSVYILSSPTGPQALLLSPSGTFSAQWPSQPRSNVGLPLMIHHHHRHHPSPTQHADHNNDPAAPVQQPRIIPADSPQPQPQPQHQQLRPNDQRRDLLRILLPLGGHIWLLIRLFGFVYFFTSGGSSRRAFFLGGIAFVVFLAQTGIFRPIWEPLRRHIEGLVAGNEQRPAGQPVPMVNAPAAGADQPRNVDREPTPHEAAARLLQERNQQNMGTLQERFRSVERAIALFVGSLVPGFGERHIAARDAAEAVRQAEEREREEAARRAEEEEAARRESPLAAQASDAPDAENIGPTQAPDQANQPPLVEI